MRLVRVLVCLMFGCAGPRAARPDHAEARAYHYSDNSGLRVTTLAVDGQRRLRDRLAVTGHAIADRIDVQRTVLDPGDPGAVAQLTGHRDADVVTSASATAGGGGVAQKWRFEGRLGLLLDLLDEDRPTTLRLTARASSEPDYKSLSAQLALTTELFDRNTALTGFLGAGNDWVDPVEKPPGYQNLWPAQHHRLTFGASGSQLLTPRLVLLAGAAATAQRGRLSSPYRRALVLAPGAVSGTLFPERLPDDRWRGTAFVGLSWYLGRGVALHGQQGVYADSWQVRAVLPELMAAKDLQVARRRGLLIARYRYYRQTAAWFHAAHYHTLDVRYLSGDPRLGGVRDHTAGVEMRWSPWSHVTAALGYDLSLLTYVAEGGRTHVRAHLPMISLRHEP